MNIDPKSFEVLEVRIKFGNSSWKGFNKMSRIPEFIEALEKMRKVHEKKNEDYAEESNPFSNFDCSEYGLKLFSNPRDGSFAWPIFTKLARLSVLLNSSKSPNHESIEDTFIDIANYLLLWRADFMRRNQHSIRIKDEVETIKEILERTKD